MSAFTDCSVAATVFLCDLLGERELERSSAIVCHSGDGPVAGMLFTRVGPDTARVGIWVEDAAKVPRTWGFNVFNYAFNVLGLKELTSYASADNDKSIKMTERVGFKQVDTAPDGSAYAYKMTEEDCWMLRSKKWSRNNEIH